MDEIKTGDIGSYEGCEYVCRSRGSVLWLYHTYNDLLYKRNKVKTVGRSKVIKVVDNSITMPDWWIRLMEEETRLRYADVI